MAIRDVAQDASLNANAASANAVHLGLERLAGAFSPDRETTAEQSGRLGAFEACLQRFLALSGWVGDERRLREALPYMQDIESLDTLCAVLFRLGFTVEARTIRINDLTPSACPCILVVNGAPLVLLSIDSLSAYEVFAPGVDPDEVDKLLQQPTIALLAAPAGVNAGAASKPWINQAMGQLKGSIGGLLALSFSANLLAMGAPLFSMAVYDYVIRAQAFSTLWYLFLAVTLALLLETYLRVERIKLIAEAGARFDVALTAALFQRLIDLPLRMTESAPVSAQVLRFRDFEGVRALFTGSITAALLDLPFALIFVAVVFFYGGALGFIPIALACAFTLIALIVRPQIAAHAQRGALARNSLQGYLMETVSKLPTIQNLDLQEEWSARAIAASAQSAEARFKSQFFENCLNVSAQALVMLAGIAALCLGAAQVMAGDMSGGALIAVMMLIWRSLTPIHSAFLSSEKVLMCGASIRQINQLMSLQPERRASARAHIDRKIEGQITAEGLSFRYAAAYEPALRGISLKINPGEVVAICGATGAGKSTLLKVLLGLYEPQSGSVYVDGLNVRQFEPSALRASVGYVGPQINLFHGTVEQNLRLIAPTVSAEALADALARAGVRPDDPQLPDGLSTWIKNWRATRLDASLQTKLALAAVYAKAPPIMLLDDPGAFLDRMGDEALIDELVRQRGRATIILVTNRPSHMRACTRIIRLDAGAIVADGRPADATKS
jgi:ATP-binding cassette subfamily C protein/ATP-binding cassette subfamily C protein LapB